MILQKGNKSVNVKLWQKFLNTQGFKITEDGDFWTATESATKAFQKMCVLREDGIVGDNTIAQAKARGFAGFLAPDNATTVDAPGKMHVSQAGQDFIKSFEKEVLQVYDDGYGYPTCGIGHRVKPEDRLKLGDKITKEQSQAFWQKDLAIHAEPVDRLVKVPLTQGQYDALVSLVFNIGEGNFAGSSLLRELNRGNYDEARVRFMDWIKSNKRVSNGLIKRRTAEQKMFRGV